MAFQEKIYRVFLVLFTWNRPVVIWGERLKKKPCTWVWGFKSWHLFPIQLFGASSILAPGAMHLYFLAKFIKHFRQIQQVKVPNKDHADLIWPLIDTYKLIVTIPYLYLVIYKSHNRKKNVSALRQFLSTVRPIFH